MNSKHRPFSSLHLEEWKNLLLVGIICFYFIVFFFMLNGFVANNFVGNDYLQYWFAGKIADEKGYSDIYSPSELKTVQQQIIIGSGVAEDKNEVTFPPLPLGYFSVFIIPFQFLSKFSVESGYIIWIILNLIVLIVYLLFFLRKIPLGNESEIPEFKLLIPFLLSYAVFFNITCGQVEVFVLICAGEFIRQAANKRSFLSGLWLGGLLLKPPLLILIIPIFLIMRYWKAVLGFLTSSGIILGTSLLLSGLDGMRALLNIWTKVTGTTAPTAPEIMINWRMVGVNLDQFLNTSFGWIIVGLGMILTIIAVFYLVRRMPPYGSPLWIMTILGVFSATLSVTWHSHYHMSMVMIPFLIYTLVHKSLPEKIILSWNCITPVVFLGYLLFETSLIALFKTNSGIFHMTILGLTGLVLNMVILYSILQSVKIRNLDNK